MQTNRIVKHGVQNNTAMTNPKTNHFAGIVFESSWRSILHMSFLNAHLLSLLLHKRNRVVSVLCVADATFPADATALRNLKQNALSYFCLIIYQHNFIQNTFTPAVTFTDISMLPLNLPPEAGGFLPLSQLKAWKLPAE